MGLYFSLHFFLQFFILLLRLDQPLQLRYNFIKHTLRARARASRPYHSIQDQIQRGTGPLLACLPWLAFITTITTPPLKNELHAGRSRHLTLSTNYSWRAIQDRRYLTIFSPSIPYFSVPFYSISRGLFVVSGCQR